MGTVDRLIAAYRETLNKYEWRSVRDAALSHRLSGADRLSSEATAAQARIQDRRRQRGLPPAKFGEDE